MALSLFNTTTTTAAVTASNFVLLNFLFIICFLPFVCSLSTFSISETSNLTSVCALVHPLNGSSATLNCSGQLSAVNSGASFSALVAGDGFVCTLRNFVSSSTSAIHCWRFSANGTLTRYRRIYFGPAIHHLEAGNSRICGLLNGTDGTSRLQCWPWNEFNSSTVNQNFSSIAVGQDFVCGLLSGTGKISCNRTGVGTSVIEQVPAGNYSVIAAGFRHACAISLNNNLECWGDVVGETPQGKFIGVASGENRNCAMRRDDTLVCWGQNNFSLPESLQGEHFISIEAKRNVFCGVLRGSYSLYCWGNDVFQSNNFLVFERILPGPCQRSSACTRFLPGYAYLCERGQSICEPSWGDIPSPPPLRTPSPSPPALPPTKESPCNSGLNGRMVAFLVVGCVGSFSLVLVCSFFLYRYCKGRGCRVHDSGRLDETGDPAEQQSSQRQTPQPQPAGPTVLEKRLSQLASIGNAGHLEEFSLEVLLEATNNFSEDHKIGTGSFGSVYHATLGDGRQVAIKRAEVSNTSARVGGTRRQQDKDHAFLNELESLSRVHHKNLVRLLGFCEDHNELVLVYEYMVNGTLHDHLHKLENSPLNSWPERMKVALHAARGIEYLHEYAVPQIIHRDIKSSNILLDDTWTAKVSDFGLSMMGPGDDESHLSILAAGTVGYMDPEYYRLQKLTTKSDVYSFGVVLLELLSGYKAIHKNEYGVPRNVVDFIVPYIAQDEIHRVLDPKVPPPTPYEIEAVAYVGYLAADCVIHSSLDRPSMSEIASKLENALNACLVPPSLSRSTTDSSTT